MAQPVKLFGVFDLNLNRSLHIGGLEVRESRNLVSIIQGDNRILVEIQSQIRLKMFGGDARLSAQLVALRQEIAVEIVC